MSYIVEYRDTATQTTTQITGIEQTSVDVTGLTAGTDYEFRVAETDGTTTSAFSDWFAFSTEAATADTTPDPFIFNDKTGAALSTSITSNAIEVTGVTAGVDIPVSVTGAGGYQVSTDGVTFGGTTTANTNVQLGYWLRVVHINSATHSTATSTTLDVGGVTDTFTSTTVAEDVAPPPGGDGWIYGKQLNPTAAKTWTWGRRHPKTGMRTRVYK